MTGYLFLAILTLSTVAFLLGRKRAIDLSSYGSLRLHSRPAYHGAFVAAWAGVPALLLVLIWIALQGPVIDRLLIASLPAEQTQGLSADRINLLLSEIRSVASGVLFREPEPFVREAAERYLAWAAISRWAMVACALSIVLIAGAVAWWRLAPAFRARHRVESFLSGLMIFCSLVAVLTTLGIVVSLLFEAMRFFARVPPSEFFFGLNWEPQIAIRPEQVAGAGAFGAVPVFAGTLLVAAIAMLVAIPIGLFSAIYLAEYADGRVRSIVKPLLEILAGIPTIVYGFFAILIVAPAVRQAGASIGIDVSPNSALVAGAVMGIMITPFVSSLSDDALGAVPQSLREGSYGLGATKAETVMKVLLPAALPGIMGGILLAVSRAIGETMIVVMAAGLIATLTANPLDSVTTVTVQIVTLLTGDTEFDNPKTLAAFALGLTLFFVTLVLNVIALTIVQRYRERYE